MRRGAEGSNFLGYSLGHYYVFGRHRPATTDLWAEYRERRRELGYDPEAVAAAAADRRPARRQGRPGAATSGCAARWERPSRCASTSGATRTCGVDMFILSCAAGRNRHEHVMESLELFAREVLPEFVERDEQLRARRRRGSSR